MKRLIAIALLVAACGGGGGAAATVTPTEAPAAEVTPDPTPDPEIGTGVIDFGLGYDPDTLRITEPRTRFKRTFDDIAYSASLLEPIGATSITFIIASQSKTGIERTLIKEEVDVSIPDADRLANQLDLAFLVDNKAGTYVVRFVRDGDVLAEGTFTLVK